VLNLIVISLAVTRYFKVNIMNTVGDIELIKMQHIIDVLFLFRKGVEYFGIIVIAYMLVKILYQIQERITENLIKYTFIFILTISAFAYGIGVTNFLNNQEAHWLQLFCDIISGIVILVVITIFTFTLLKFKLAVNCDPKFSLRLFLIFYLIILSIFFLQSLFSFKYQDLFVMTIILIVNLFPMLWSNYNLQMETSNGFSLNINMESIERIVSEYNISNREREILEYILRGYSNREIQRRFFLSPHTVKNHIYNLYKKLGIRNRGELMRKTFEYQSNK